MNMVYAYAHQVLIWLGESCWTPSLVQILRLVHLWAKEHGFDSILPMLQYPQDEHDDQKSHDDYEHLSMNTLLDLYESRWFQRRWVLQEVALARSATVLWGQHKISWEYVGVAASILRTNYALINSPLRRGDRTRISQDY